MDSKEQPARSELRLPTASSIVGDDLIEMALDRASARTFFAMSKTELGVIRQVLSAGSLLLVLSCSDEITDPGKRSADIVIPAEAEDVAFMQRDGYESTAYSLVVACPATEFVDEIVKNAETRKWHDRKTLSDHPSVPTAQVRGWVDYTDRTAGTPRIVRQWIAEWNNAQGDLMRCSLQFENPAEDRLRAGITIRRGTK